MNRLFRAASLIAARSPRPLRRIARASLPTAEFDLWRREDRNSFFDEKVREYDGSGFRLGVVREPSQFHKFYIAACQEKEISYCEIDLLAEDWWEQLVGARVDALLVWPTSVNQTIKQILDARLALVQQSGVLVFPSPAECSLTEDKVRCSDWLRANNVPCPDTHIFTSRESALGLARSSFPVVVKTPLGASGSGVWIVRSFSQYKRFVRKAFGAGLVPRGGDRRNRQRGVLIVQAFLPDVVEWRLVRIGDSFFGHRKGTAASGLHSGAKHCDWLDPGPRMLNFLRKVTDLGNFRSMDVDVFLTKDGSLLVNELQAVFGCSVATTQMKIEGVPGRYTFDAGSWSFEEGEFCRNHVCNLRVDYVIQQLTELRSLEHAR